MSLARRTVSGLNNAMRSGIMGDGARKRTITVYTDRERFVDALEMTPEKIYTLLLGQDGEIVWRAEGRASEAKLQGLHDALAKHLRKPVEDDA